MRSEARKLPKLFLERLRKIIPPQKWDEIANTFTEPRPTTFRINTLKGGAIHELPLRIERLEHLGFRLEKVPWYPDAFILRAGRLRDLQETDFYKKGEIYIQSLSSMLPPLVLNPQPGERVLDLTAAPGSKTTQMACLMKGEGEIVANDNNQIRFFKLKANVELQVGARRAVPLQIKLTLRPGELFGRDWPESFDRVLLDAPCSAEGRFLATEPASYKYWKPAKIKEMARKQKNLILSAFRALKPGGTLVYSTCTFAPEENENVVDWLIEKCRGGVSPSLGRGDLAPAIEKITLPFPNQMPGLIRWETEGKGARSYAPAVRNTLRILPTPLMEGFYIARVRKIG